MPEETVIGVDIGYATAVFAIPDDARSDWKAMRTLPNIRESSRGGLMLPLEGGRWMVTLGGRHGDKPPGNAEGFLAFAQQLRTPTLYNAIGRAKRLGDVVRFGFSASVWRHFERLETFPRGLLPFGDTICCFNPVYGQGMSVAAQEALLLHRLLGSREGDALAGLAPSFFAEARGLIETPWASAAAPDFAFPEIEGQRPPDLEHTLKFRRALNRLAAADPGVHQQILEVQHLIKPRSVLRDPALVERVQAMMAAA
jgi:2-polyprenyl-6-methoxyphenol hydroxylase-like FAD-dependent oxidoreductase